MSRIMELRSKYKDVFKEKHGVGLGFMSFFAKACSVALSEWPAVNAYIDGDEVVYHDYADISIAVSTPRGLTVPVLRNVESMSMADVEKKVGELAVKARDNKLTMEELTGGTFTITNGGVFGSLMSTPILNLPQSAILGMHKIQERPIALNGQVVIRPMMYVALSYDHRIIDGKDSVGFLVKVKELIEEEGSPDLKLRVFVSGGGCSGFQYGFTFEETVNEDDTQVERDSVTLLIDPMSLQYLMGAEIDYQDSLQGSQFVIKNPNATTTCGCGSSFSA
jgi:2-oxoglutarate dehydrogenase complex dihydrolipoamide succinyltransferase (E2) component